jgi:hypothetical protein
MCPEIGNPSSYKIRSVIRFLHARNMIAAEIHCELFAFYDQNVMSEENIRQWFIMFKDGRKMFMVKSEVVGRPSVVSSCSEC